MSTKFLVEKYDDPHKPPDLLRNTRRKRNWKETGVITPGRLNSKSICNFISTIEVV